MEGIVRRMLQLGQGFFPSKTAMLHVKGRTSDLPRATSPVNDTHFSVCPMEFSDRGFRFQLALQIPPSSFQAATRWAQWAVLRLVLK